MIGRNRPPSDSRTDGNNGQRGTRDNAGRANTGRANTGHPQSCQHNLLCAARCQSRWLDSTGHGSPTILSTTTRDTLNLANEQNGNPTISGRDAAAQKSRDSECPELFPEDRKSAVWGRGV